MISTTTEPHISLHELEHQRDELKSALAELTSMRGQRLDAEMDTTDIENTIESLVCELSKIEDRIRYRQSQVETGVETQSAEEREMNYQRKVKAVESILAFSGGMLDPLLTQLDEVSASFYKRLSLASADLPESDVRALLCNAKLVWPRLVALAANGILHREGVLKTSISGYLPTADLIKRESHK